MTQAITRFSGEYDFLSNFYRCPFIYQKRHGATAEHHFQAAKAWNKDDGLRILNATTPGKAKRLGREIMRRPDWDAIRIDVMYDILCVKFQNVVLRHQLLRTGDMELVEGNFWYDTFWGQCPVGVGENQLGKALMRLRATLR